MQKLTYVGNSTSNTIQSPAIPSFTILGKVGVQLLDSYDNI